MQRTVSTKTELKNLRYTKLSLETVNKGHDSGEEMHVKWNLPKNHCVEYIELKITRHSENLEMIAYTGRRIMSMGS